MVFMYGSGEPYVVVPVQNPLGLSACLLCRKKAFQHNSQLPKRWSGWGDMPNSGVLAYLPGEGGGVPGVDHVCTVHGNLMYGLGQPYIYALQLHCVSSLDAHGHTLWVAS